MTVPPVVGSSLEAFMARLRLFLLPACLALLVANTPARASLLGIDWITGNLYDISESDASTNLIDNTGINLAGDMQYNPNDGKIYAWSASVTDPSVLYSVDGLTAASTTIGSLGLNAVEGGLAFRSDGYAYGVSALDDQGGLTHNRLFTLDLNTGHATIIGDLSNPYEDINGLAYRSDGMLVGLDGTSNSLVLIDPNTLTMTTLVNLQPAVGDVGGMTVDGGVGYFNTAGPAYNGSNELYKFDLFTGSYSLVGAFDRRGSISGLAGVPSGPPSIPEPGTWMLMGVGLIGFAAVRRRA
jgi:hypothetical protein